uniref:Uncharacterized protein n=1 Tax=Aegilops tauschii TaxID=37682 RepID=M8C4E9_AEGTA
MTHLGGCNMLATLDEALPWRDIFCHGRAHFHDKTTNIVKEHIYDNTNGSDNHGPFAHIPQDTQSSPRCGITASPCSIMQPPQHKLKERPHCLECRPARQIQNKLPIAWNSKRTRDRFCPSFPNLTIATVSISIAIGEYAVGGLHQRLDGSTAECHQKLLQLGVVGRVCGSGADLIVGVDVDGLVNEDAHGGGREDLHPAADRPTATPTGDNVYPARR